MQCFGEERVLRDPSLSDNRVLKRHTALLNEDCGEVKFAGGRPLPSLGLSSLKDEPERKEDWGVEITGVVNEQKAEKLSNGRGQRITRKFR